MVTDSVTNDNGANVVIVVSEPRRERLVNGVSVDVIMSVVKSFSGMVVVVSYKYDDDSRASDKESERVINSTTRNNPTEKEKRIFF